MTKGIIIYALGHSNYYRMAENLAASLVANGTKEAAIAIALICDDEKKVLHKKLFDKFIILSPGQFMDGDKIVFNNATVLAYDLSPYDRTIKLDADMIWIDKRLPAALFEELESVDITFSNTGCGWNAGHSIWADDDAVKEVYNLTGEEKLYRIFGEFIYFRKCASNEEYFNLVKKIYRERKVKSVAFSNGSFTDELAFQIACMLSGIYPHQDKYTPVYNKFLGYNDLIRKYPYQLTGFYGYSIGGNLTDNFTKDAYNNLASHYFNKLGLLNPYQAINKKSFLPERKKL